MSYVLFYTLCVIGSCRDTHVVLHGDTFDYCKSVAVETQQELTPLDSDARLTWKCLPSQGPVQERGNVLMTADEILRNHATTVPYYIDIPIIKGPETDSHLINVNGSMLSTVVDISPEALAKIRDACRPAKDKGAP